MVQFFRTPLGVIALAATGFVLGGSAAAANGPFLAHQALYDLSLVKSRGSNPFFTSDQSSGADTGAPLYARNT